MAPTDSQSQHVVTAVIVAHDGTAWLPRLMDALNEQTKPVQRVVAVDTGSRDRSGSVLAALVGQSAVFGMDRSAGYGAAVRRAVQHKAASAPVSAGPSSRARDDQVEWLWLLHDDCEPAADALEQLLRGAAETPGAAVLGPKLMDWTDRDVVVETGLTIDTAGRRITGIEPREVDQGQHDGDRDTLAVSSAGMLIRRDVWEQTGGFDPGMALFAEDVDFCWRVHSAGYRVRVITDAVVFHVQAASRRRRAVSVGRRPLMLERRNGLVTLLANLPFGAMLISLVGNLMLSAARTVFYLVAKRPTAALDESAAVFGVVGHPLQLASARRRRARGRRAAYSRLRAEMPAGRSIRRSAEFAAMMFARSAPEDLAGAHHATDDPTDDDSLLVDTGLMQRLLTQPAVLLTLALILIAGAAERHIVTGGTLGGGSLLPAWEGASGLWSEFVRAYHPVGTGSASIGPPYVGFVALLAWILLGKAWLAIDVLLLGCVPLAGITAFLALRRVAKSAAIRVWAAASYALLPIAFGAISAGRLGSATAFVLIPLIGLLAGRMFSQPPRVGRRAAWAIGLTVTVGAAFVPLLWPMAVVGVVAAGLALQRQRAMLVNLAIVALTPLLLLLPWLGPVLAHPTRLLLEAGIQQPGLASARLPGRSLLLLSPGGPGLPPYWVTGALLLVALAALLASRRLALIVSGWVVAIFGFAVALVASRVVVTPAGGQPVVAWPGVPLAVAAAGLLLAAAAGADALGTSLSRGRRTGVGRLASPLGFGAVILGLVACTAPLLAAAYWIMNGVGGPIKPASGGQVVPTLVSSTGAAGRQLRTLVLTSSRGHVSYLLLRGGSPQFADPNLTPVPMAQTALAQAVAALVAPGGGEAVNQSQLLARFDIGFVLMKAPLDAGLAGVLDGVPGLTGVSMTPQFDLWRLSVLPSLVSVVEPNGAVVPVASGPVGVSGAAVPAAGGTVLLAEPAGGWSASVKGNALTPVPSPGSSWAQAWKLPAGSGTLTISRNTLVHDLVMALELLAFAVVAVLALPGIRTQAEMEEAASDSQDALPGEPSKDARERSGTGQLVHSGGGHGGRDRRDALATTMLSATADGARRDPEPVGAGGAAYAGGQGAPFAGGQGPAYAGGQRPAFAGGRGPEYAGAVDAADAAEEQSGADGPRRRRSEEAGRSRRDKLTRGRKPARGGRSRSAGRGDGSGQRGRDNAGEADGSGARRSGDGRQNERTGGSPPQPSRAGSRLGRGATAARDAVSGAGVAGAAAAAGAVAGLRRGRSQSDSRAPERSYADSPPYGEQPYGDQSFDDRQYGGGSARGSSPGYAGTPGYGGPPGSGGSRGYGDEPRRKVMSPSGTPFDDDYGSDHAEPPGSRPSSHGREPGDGGEAGYRGGHGRDGGRSYDNGPAYSDAGYQGDAGYSGRGGYADERGQGYGDRSDYAGRPGYADRSGYRDGDDYGRGGQSANSWGEADESSAWPSGDQWPSSGEQRGWPEPGQQARPDSGGLEALPGEVHHDWPGREDRGTRGWPAPSRDGEEDETW